jgi:ABC-type multidrug transport system fused ATPase/permease subunit
MSAAGASEKVFEYLDKKIDPDLKNTYQPETLQGEIEFKDISFTYPNRPEVPVLKV